MTRLQEIKLESLDDGPGLLPYRLGLMKLATHYHTFLQYVHLNDIEVNVHSLQTQLFDFRERLTNDTYSLYELQIDYLTNKLDKVLSKLDSLEPKRAKRGLVDGLGSIIKSISGNLDHTDALKYDEAIRTLESNQNNVISELNNHVSLSKEWMNKHTDVLEQLVKNQNKINHTIELILESNSYKENSLIKYAKFAQILEIVGENVEDMMQGLLRIENSLAFVHASSMHHSMIDITILSSMINKLKVLYGRDRILDLELREYYDIIEPGSYYTDKQIVLVFQFPIVARDNFDLYKLAVVPNRYAQALIPPLPFIATNEMSFLYMEAECPKLNNWYLCEKSINHQLRTKPDCVQELITNEVLQETCQFTTVTLMREAMEKLDDQHYILSFPNKTKVQLICNQKDYTTLQGSYLTTIPIGCRLKTEEFTVANDYDEINGQPLKLAKIDYDAKKQAAVSTHVNLNSIDLQGLHDIQEKIMMQSPVEAKYVRMDALYHTTIPFYAVTLSGVVLIVILVTRRYLWECKKTPTKSQESPAVILQKQDYPGDIPATFSLNVLK